MTKNRFSCRIRTRVKSSPLCRLQCRVLWLFRMLRLRRRVDYPVFFWVRNSLEFWDSFESHTAGMESSCKVWELYHALVELDQLIFGRRINGKDTSQRR